MEVAALRRLQGATPHVCELLGCGRNEKINYVVMTLLGPNLSELRKRQPDQKFSLSTTLRVGVQIVTAVRAIHDCGFLHRDIKPSNFAIGADPCTSRTCYMLDFGLARQYTTPTGEVRPARPVAGFRGTVRYASINAHLSKDLGRHDDLWSVFYLLVELATGMLPWRKLRDRDEAGKFKAEYDHKKLIKTLPSEFQSLLGHLEALTYSDKPNYSFILGLFGKATKQLGAQESDPLDWEQDFSVPSATTASVGSPPAVKSPEQAQGREDGREKEGGSRTNVSEVADFVANGNVERSIELVEVKIVPSIPCVEKLCIECDDEKDRKLSVAEPEVMRLREVIEASSSPSSSSPSPSSPSPSSSSSAFIHESAKSSQANKSSFKESGARSENGHHSANNLFSPIHQMVASQASGCTGLKKDSPVYANGVEAHSESEDMRQLPELATAPGLPVANGVCEADIHRPLSRFVLPPSPQPLQRFSTESLDRFFESRPADQTHQLGGAEDLQAEDSNLLENRATGECLADAALLSPSPLEPPVDKFEYETGSDKESSLSSAEEEEGEKRETFTSESSSRRLQERGSSPVVIHPESWLSPPVNAYISSGSSGSLASSHPSSDSSSSRLLAGSHRGQPVKREDPVKRYPTLLHTKGEVEPVGTTLQGVTQLDLPRRHVLKLQPLLPRLDQSESPLSASPQSPPADPFPHGHSDALWPPRDRDVTEAARLPPTPASPPSTRSSPLILSPPRSPTLQRHSFMSPAKRELFPLLPTPAKQRDRKQQQQQTSRPAAPKSLGLIPRPPSSPPPPGHTCLSARRRRYIPVH